MKKPKVACKFPRCPELVNRGYCEKHKKLGEYPSGDYHHLYESQRWIRYRKLFIAQHPLCVKCKAEGRIVPADVVDHIMPHKGDRDFFWNTDNHQALCYSCHRIKTAQESGWNVRGEGVLETF